MADAAPGGSADERPAAPAPTEWGKGLRACVACRLLKTADQFVDGGCENCPFLAMDGDRERVYDCTTTEFSVRGGARRRPAAGGEAARRRQAAGGVAARRRGARGGAIAVGGGARASSH
jgi:hypothetical protein